ncbi:phosphotransferase [Virgibacillus oceani]|uniref:Aminoglycoside phosphotransferase domain-containing protein n=1 Tax=Virgibacillus oceani TaxID=1479511 RepID=A0A917LWY4_9BACI|nr:phosphotransferase [Virgibacillus oceani]GGG62587.1 hypothetical protein GCM10011398_02420 [Virgibacillus oceani]
MSSNSSRDELKTNRLSSFLYREGKLRIAKAAPIKSTVILVETETGSKFILKKHSKKVVVDQQWEFFANGRSSVVIPFIRFPNGKKFLVTSEHYWTIAPFVEGIKLNYGLISDRKACITTLRSFHDNAQGIKVSNPIKRKLFYNRWYNRLQSFKRTNEYFVKNGFESLFTDIVQTTETQLLIVSELPWRKLEQKAEQQHSWIHGDVASHNFIRNNNIYLIDFDLLAQSPIIYDYIQLAQRFLPHLDWDLEALLAYQMVEENQFKNWILAMAVPSDVLREWLHYLSGSSPMPIHHYLTDMEKEWIKRQEFLKNAKSMLKLYY